jgi:hypothetical protein
LSAAPRSDIWFVDGYSTTKGALTSLNISNNALGIRYSDGIFVMAGIAALAAELPKCK